MQSKYVNMVLDIHRNHEAYQGRGEGGGGGGGEREIIYLSLHCHHQNDFCIMMGSDESHFKVSAESDGQSHRTVSTNHNLSEARRAEAVSNRGPSTFQPNALPLGHTGTVWRAEKDECTVRKLDCFGVCVKTLYRRKKERENDCLERGK